MTRLMHVWRELEPEQRLAALTSLGLFASMFLPWYSKTDTLVVRGAPKATETSLSAFQAFSFVEAAVLLVSAAVLSMLLARAEARRFQLPGGDGVILMIAGGWTALLIFYRLLDKPGLQGNDRVTATVGVEWGIFIALLLALGLAYAGGRIRALERPPAPLRRSRRGGTRAVLGDPEPRWDPEPPWDPSPPRAPRPRPPAKPRLDGEPRAQRERAVAADLAAADLAAVDPDATVVIPGRERAGMSARPVAPVPARAHREAQDSDGARKRGERSPFPPAPPALSPKGEQLSFEDPPTRSE
jgi:hypothetical protein